MRQLILAAFLLVAGLAKAAALAPVVAPVDVPNTMAERVKPCVACHGLEDRVGRDTYYPRIAGKPKGYLFNQLRNFRDGLRYYRPMTLLLANMTDQYLLEMATYFSTLKQPYPPPERMTASPTQIRLAQQLINQGDPARQIPACVQCHGNKLMGTAPFVPGLLGLPRIYMIAQFGAWQNGGLMRGQTVDCMSEIAKQLTAEETNAVAAWLAAQPVPENGGPTAVLPVEMTRLCGSIVHRATVE